MNSPDSLLLERAVEAQPDHPIYPRIGVEQLRALPPETALQLLSGRSKAIKNENEDPFRYGYEPPFWDVVDWELCRLRAENPGVVLEILILGGNRAAKTEFAAKRSVAGMVHNAGWQSCLLHLDEGASRAVQQKRVWKYLPPEWKPDSGKAKKTRVAKMNYNELTGFTENAFALSNGSQCIFKFYSADVTSVEGLEFDAVWSDELIPLNWMEAIEYRLLTRAAHTAETSLLCHGLLTRKARGEIDRFPAEHIARLYQGVHIVTFTPVLGYTPTAARFLTGATTVQEVPAELLPLTQEDGSTEFEKVPRLQRCKEPNRMVAYFHTYDNKHGGNWHGMKAKLAREPRKKIRERAYGIPTSAFNTRFPLFGRESHVRPQSWLRAPVTWYHICDPCPGRNFAMVWIAVNALGEAFVAREWPQEDDYIPAVGNPGPWAIPSPKGRLDGDRGDAQLPFGFGILNYKREIARVERELHGLLHPAVHAERKLRIPVYQRIIDSRGGAAPSLAHTSPVTIIEQFEKSDPSIPDDEEIYFEPSSRTLTDEGGSATITDGVELVNDLLNYDQERSVIDATGLRSFLGRAPRLFVAENCTNTIFALETWTGTDGQKGACKDFADLIRYFAQAGAEFISEDILRRGRRGGSF